MKRVVRALTNGHYEVVDLFDSNTVEVLSKDQIRKEIKSGVSYYGVSKRGKIRVFGTVSEMLEFDNLQRRLTGQPKLLYSVDEDDIVVVGVVRSDIVHDLMIPAFVTSIDTMSGFFKRVYIPDSVQELGEHCFEGSEIESISLPEHLRAQVEDNKVFKWCNVGKIEYRG